MNNINEVALIGRQNTGKTSIFNKLTRGCQRVGNWAGVTVEKNEGSFCIGDKIISLVDLPGCYSLIETAEMSLDEKVACQYLKSHPSTLFVHVIDAGQLKRDLYLTLQLLELGVPLIIAVNRYDQVLEQKIAIATRFLSELLGIVVVPLSAKTGFGIGQLVQSIGKAVNKGDKYTFQADYLNAVMKKITLQPEMTHQTDCTGFNPIGVCIQALEGDQFFGQQYQSLYLEQEKRQLGSVFKRALDVYIAYLRHQKIDSIVQAVSYQAKPMTMGLFTLRALPSWLDKVLLNRLLGLPIFLMIMYLMFTFSINFGGLFQEFFDLSTQALFIEWPREILSAWGLPSTLIHITANGLGRGINITATFIPVIACLYLSLAFLEHSGYMARAAFVVDRLMRFIGLSGKCFVPMIIGFGCNVPAVLGARTLEHRNERILTILMTPFMSCSARLAIYAVFVAAFFPTQGQNVIFALYLVGIVVAVFTGLILRKLLLNGQISPFIMELPAYQWPSRRWLLQQMWHRLRRFLSKAGTLIVPFCVLISMLGAFKPNSDVMLKTIGHSVTPIFQPMGVKEDNWQAVVSLIAGMMAKEVVVGSLTALYAEDDDSTTLLPTDDLSTTGLLLKEAMGSVTQHFQWLGGKTAEQTVEAEVDNKLLGVLYLKFDSTISAFSYLLFVLLYFPCVSVVAVMSRELNKRWAIFSVFWSTSMAYMVAVLFYQLATLMQHPSSSILWLLGIPTAFGFMLYLIRCVMRNDLKSQPVSIPTKIMVSS